MAIHLHLLFLAPASGLENLVVASWVNEWHWYEFPQVKQEQEELCQQMHLLCASNRDRIFCCWCCPLIGRERTETGDSCALCARMLPGDICEDCPSRPDVETEHFLPIVMNPDGFRPHLGSPGLLVWVPSDTSPTLSQKTFCGWCTTYSSRAFVCLLSYRAHEGHINQIAQKARWGSASHVHHLRCEIKSAFSDNTQAWCLGGESLERRRVQNHGVSILNW